MRILVSLLALFVLGGCASHPPPGPAPAASDENKTDRRIIFDAALLGKLKILSLATNTTTADLLQFQVDIQNLTPIVRSVTYHIDWLGKDGLSLGFIPQELHWLLLPHETAPLTMTAPTPLAKDFRLYLLPRAATPSPTPP